MNNRRVSPRLCLILTVALSLVGVALRSICLLCFYDADPGYFTKGPLSTLSNALYFVALAAAVVCVLLPPKAAYSITLRTPLRAIPAAGLGGVLAAFTILSLLLCCPTRTSQIILAPTVLGIFSSLYYFLSLRREGLYPDWLAFLGYLPVLWSITAVGDVYFDSYVTMNSPVKIALQLGFLGFMLIGLAELRFRVGRPLPRYAAFFWSIGTYTCLVASVPILLATGAGILGNLTHTLYAAVLLLAGLYGLYLLFSHTANPANRPHHTAP